MSKSAMVPSRRILILLTFVTGFALPFAAAAEARVSQSYGKLPLHFEANRGQTHGDVRFLARGPGYSLFLTPTEAVLTLMKPESPARKPAAHGKSEPRGPATGTVLRMTFAGANPDPLVSGLEELPGKANYFIGNDPMKWRTNVPTYAKVRYREVYPGIDLVHYGNQRQLEYDFVVAPGADPKKIVLDFHGAERLEIDARGELVLHTAGGTLRQKKPVIYQEIDRVRTEIEGSYVFNRANRVGFEIAAYDRSRPLVIDPILSYSTYLGGSGNDFAKAVAVDSDGNAYVTGDTGSLNFPTTTGVFQPAGVRTGASDAFVTKLNPTGSALVYSTYLGSNDVDQANAIALDSDGNAYVAGTTTSRYFPTTPGAFQTSFGGGYTDAFVAKVNTTGSELVYSTYLGGSDFDEMHGIAVDAAGNAYVTGLTTSINYPTANAFQEILGGEFDAFVTKLNPAGSALVYSTYLGGSRFEFGNGIAVDASGHAYVTGPTQSVNFPTTPGAFQTSFGGGYTDAFVAKVNTTGSELVYSTYLGGSDFDQSQGIAVDAAGNAYVTGVTVSTNFPTSLGAFQTSCGGIDAFVTKLNSTGSGLVYSTYLGGSGSDTGSGIAVDAHGNAYVTGNSNSGNFPTTSDAYQGTSGGSYDAFVTKLDSTGSGLVYSTYLGGSGWDVGLGIAVDAHDNIYIAGQADSRNFPITPGAFQPIFAGGIEDRAGRSWDSFVAKIGDAAPAPYSGTPIAIPGSFEAEDFDLGGEGVAYHDNVPGNAGGQYRPDEDVDIIASADSAGGGYVVHNFETGEWLAYTINVATSAQYDIELRVSSEFLNSAFHIEIDGVDVTGSVTAPNTGSWEIFQWVGKKGVALTAGQHVLKIFTDQQYFDLNSVRVLPSMTRSEESAASYGGSWASYGTETGTFSGGSVLASNGIGSTATFHFTGTAVTWIGVKCNVCGIATVSLDGGLPTMVNAAGPDAPGSLSSEPVFSASGLNPAVPHTLAITVTGATTSLLNLLNDSSYIAVDAFDVKR